MMSIRLALANYLDEVRAFVFEVIKLGSAVYDPFSSSKVLQQPDAWIQAEADWIDELLEALGIIQQYVNLVNRWANHVFGIAHNLSITAIEITKIERRQTSVAALLQTKTFDEDYLQWVLADVSQEVDRLVVETQELLEKAPRFLELTEQFRGSFMENVKQIALAWTTQNLEKLYEQLIEVLDGAHSGENPREVMKYLVKYCDIIFSVVFSTPMFIDESSPTVFSSRKMKTSRSRIDQLSDGLQNLREFVKLRKMAYLRFLQHVEALLRAVLPLTDSVSKWVEEFLINPSKSASDLLPQEISIVTLELALTQAEEARADWEKLSELLVPLRKGAHKLNTVLQSPILEEFLDDDQSRRALTNKLRRRMESKFKAIRKSLTK
ncbi:MAG: hypothetical protein ACFFDP_01240 [Promethearchaeota archaeon]